MTDTPCLCRSMYTENDLACPKHGPDALESRFTKYPVEVAILDQTAKAVEAHGFRYGADFVSLSWAQFHALQVGKLLAIEVNGGEYVLYLRVGSAPPTQSVW